MPRVPAGVLHALLIVALAWGCGQDKSTAASAQTQRPERGPAQPAAGAAAPREVRVIPAAREDISRGVVVSGTLGADEQIVLSLKIPGRLADLTVDLGSPVRRGQSVARLDPTDFRLRVDQAESALHQARVRLGLPAEGIDDRVDPERTSVVRQARAVLDEARLTQERMTRLAQQELVARAQLDAAVAALQVAEGRYQDAIEEVRNRQAVLAQRRTELELARQQLADTVLTAPADGMIRERRAAVGEYLAAGAPVATMVRIHPLRLVLAVPERVAAAVRVGQPVKVTVEGDTTVHSGRVARLAPSFQEQNRTLTVEVEVPNDRGRLRPGSFARAEIVIVAAEPAVFVPLSALVTFAGVEKVLVVHDGKVVERRVATGRRDDKRVEITEGLQGGEPVVVEPGNLVGGQAVRVVGR